MDTPGTHHPIRCHARSAARFEAPPPPTDSIHDPSRLRKLFDGLRTTPKICVEDQPPEIRGYDLLEEIGRGGMGVVYRANQIALQRQVALKVIRGAGLPTREQRERFRIEAEAAAKLQHPGIVQVFEVGEHDGRPFIVMELLAGSSLDKRLSGTPLPPRDAAKLVASLSDAAEFAHAHGVVHRDLKPANVLLDGSAFGRAKISDFSLAKQLNTDSGQTQSGAVIGTPSYMAPEQASGKVRELGPSVDIYALGAILYESLTGRPPFRAATMLETLELVRTEEPVAPSRLQPGLPRDLQTICLKCLCKEPHRRYTRARELAGDLERFLRGEPIQARPVGSIERVLKWARRKPTAASLAVVCGLAVAGVIVGLAWHQQTLRKEIQRANHGEADAIRQKKLALANFRKGHESLDEVFTRLEEDTHRSEDPRFNRLRRDIAEASLKFYDEVLQEVDDPDPELRLNRGLVLIYAGRLRQLLHEYTEADHDLTEAETILTGLTTERPDNAAAIRELAYCRYRQGALLESLDRIGDAFAKYNQALQGISPIAHEGERERRLLGLCNWQLFVTSRALHKPGATGYVRESVRVWTALCNDYPENHEYRMRLLDNLRNDCFDRLARQDYIGLDALIAQAELAAKPYRITTPRHLFDLFGVLAMAEIYRGCGFADSCQGRFDSAREKLDKGIEVIQRVLKQEPSSTEASLVLAGLYYARARVLECLHRWDEAEYEWDKAISLAQLKPSDPESANSLRIERANAIRCGGSLLRAFCAANDLARRSDLTSENLLHLAYCFAAILVEANGQENTPWWALLHFKEGSIKRAMECLDRLERAGWFADPAQRDDLLHGPKLGPLRERPEFEQLLQRIANED